MTRKTSSLYKTHDNTQLFETSDLTTTHDKYMKPKRVQQVQKELLVTPNHTIPVDQLQTEDDTGDQDLFAHRLHDDE